MYYILIYYIILLHDIIKILKIIHIINIKILLIGQKSSKNNQPKRSSQNGTLVKLNMVTIVVLFSQNFHLKKLCYL